MNVYSTGTNLSKHPFWHQGKRLLDPVVELLVVGYEGGGDQRLPGEERRCGLVIGKDPRAPRCGW